MQLILLRFKSPRSRAGNATQPLLYFLYILLGICVLTGRWYFLLYALAGVLLFVVVLMYAVYLEYNAQRELERRRREEAAAYARFGRRI